MRKCVCGFHGKIFSVIRLLWHQRFGYALLYKSKNWNTNWNNWNTSHWNKNLLCNKKNSSFYSNLFVSELIDLVINSKHWRLTFIYDIFFFINISRLYLFWFHKQPWSMLCKIDVFLQFSIAEITNVGDN